MAGDIDSKNSTSCYMIIFVGGVVAWQPMLQKCVALSTKEVEFIVITKACEKLIWLNKLFYELDFFQE